MKFKLFFLLACFALFSSDCRQKKLFRNIEVSGRLINFYTKEPLSGEKIVLRANDVHSASSYATAAIELVSGFTNSDGSFSLKSKASKKNSYHLQLGDSNNVDYIRNIDTSFTAEPGSSLNFGNLNSGVHTVFYKIRFTSISGNCFWYTLQYPNEITIRAGADTTIKFAWRASYASVKGGKNNIHMIGKSGNCADPKTVVVSTFSFPLNYMDTSYFQHKF